MKYCEICINKKQCEGNNWCITMDRNRILAETKELLCDNFKTDENVTIIEKRLK